MLNQPFYYKNHQGQTVDFTVAPFGWNGLEPLDWDWTPNVKARPFLNGSRLIRLSKSYREFAILVIAKGTAQEVAEGVNHLNAVVEVDLLSKTQGQLWLGEQYINCFVTASVHEEYIQGNFVSFELTIFTLYPFWTTEELNSFATFSTGAATGFILPTALPFNIGTTLGTSRIVNEHYAPSQAVITMFGPAVNPSFTIGDHVYTVNGALGAGERFVIDQRANTLVKITQPGEVINAFNQRGKQYSVFEPIPVGESQVYYSGEFAIDILLLKERSAPQWS